MVSKNTFIIILSFFFLTCENNENELGSNQAGGIDAEIIEGGTIYIVGSDGDGACYWVNGSRIELPGGAWATDITVVDGTVYTCGTGEASDACYWIDQTRYDLPGAYGEAEAIDVYDGDVYVAGWFDNGSCYWKNGERIDLTVNRDSQAFAIGVRNNGMVYVGGYYMNNHHYIIPCFWKDGNNRTNLPVPSGGDGEVYDITFDEAGTMRYYAGFTMALGGFAGYKPVAARWRHTVRTDLPDGTSDISLYGTGSYGITIDGEDIYVAGYTDWIGDTNDDYSGGTYPRYWKNNKAHDLEGGPHDGNFGTGQANDIRFADGNLVVVGMATGGPTGESACYWLNGELNYLEDVIGEGSSEAKGVFIE
ncbi:MAG: hypothetical protein CMG62_03310 [Candidatus Marinimicrobia bacterium]|nr:hypothetical protein [Candidatus Neomarinimicrobiota bacterium]